jgi:hypothetical protein
VFSNVLQWYESMHAVHVVARKYYWSFCVRAYACVMSKLTAA